MRHMASWSAILVVAAKDVAQRSRDRSAFIMGLLAPLALALILGGTLGGADDPAAALAPPFELASSDGEPVRLDDYRGVPVAVTFMHTW